MNNASTFVDTLSNYWAGVVFLLVFVTSALICGIIVSWQPFLLWEKKMTKEAVQLVFYTGGWLIVFFLLILMSRLV
mgnify:CR=1 FL=1